MVGRGKLAFNGILLEVRGRQEGPAQRPSRGSPPTQQAETSLTCCPLPCPRPHLARTRGCDCECRLGHFKAVCVFCPRSSHPAASRPHRQTSVPYAGASNRSPRARGTSHPPVVSVRHNISGSGIFQLCCSGSARIQPHTCSVGTESGALTCPCQPRKMLPISGDREKFSVAGFFRL